jgi:hypothetical protein
MSSFGGEGKKECAHWTSTLGRRRRQAKSPKVDLAHAPKISFTTLPMLGFLWNAISRVELSFQTE